MNAATDLRQRLGTALGLLQRGQGDRARAVLQEILIGYPGQVNASGLLARLYRQAGELEKAQAVLAAVHNGDAQPAFVAECGYLAMVRLDYGEARTCFERLVVLRPGHADAWFNLGQACKLTGDLQRAVESWQHCLGLGVNNPTEVHIEIGSALTILRCEKDAERAFTEALELQPGAPRALYGLGVIRAAFGDFEAALALFRDALAKTPGMVEAYQQIVACRRFTRIDDPDIRAIETLLSDSGLDGPARETLQFALGKAYDDAGAYDLAFANYAAANRHHRRHHSPYDRAGHEELVARIRHRFASVADGPPAGDESPAPIFIVGMPRSGTTLLERIVSGHPVVAPGGELPFFDAVARVGLDGYRGDPAELDADRLRRDYLAQLGGFAGGASAVTNKYPANFLHLGLIRYLFPAAKIIHCRRDPLDTGLSVFLQDFPTGNRYAFDLADIGHYLAQYQRLMDHWSKVFGGALLHVDYADMVGDKANAARRIWAFLDLPDADATVDHREGASAVATLSRWQVRQPVYTTSVGRWRNYESHLGPLRDALAAGASPKASGAVPEPSS